MRKKRTYIQLLSFLPALTIMVMIFLFSAQPAHISQGTSSPLAEGLVHVWERFFGEFKESVRLEQIDRMDVVVRKTAHMTEYLLLSLSIGIPLYYYHFRSKKLYLITFLSSVFYAGTDEFHQLFVEGRSGRISDVGIDSIGIAIGCLVLFFYINAKTKAKQSDLG